MTDQKKLRVSLLSDLHIEHFKYQHDLPDADFLVLAGDICDAEKYKNKNYLDFKDLVFKKFKNNVIEINGNHEGYNGSIHTIEGRRGIRIVDGVCFIYATLWSGDGSELAYLKTKDSNYIKGFTFEWMSNEHKRDVRHIEYYLDKYKHMTTVVITHYLPHYDCVDEKYKNTNNMFNDVTKAFYTDLDWLIKKHSPNYWFCGHTHISFNKKIRDTNVIINPKGVGLENAYGFDPNLVIDIKYNT